MKKRSLLTLFIFFICFSAFAQSEKILTHEINGEYWDWPFKDLETDSIPGISLDRVYKEFIKDNSGKEIIVAIIDTSIDISHPDLKDAIYTNTDEIPFNGIDDDNNGYIDDVHGWNYLGYDNKILLDGVYPHIAIIQENEDYLKNAKNAKKVDSTLLATALKKYNSNKENFKRALKSGKDKLESYNYLRENLNDYFPNEDTYDWDYMESVGEMKDSVTIGHIDNVYALSIGSLGIDFIKNGYQSTQKSAFIYNNIKNRLWDKSDSKPYDMEYNGYGSPHIQLGSGKMGHGTQVGSIIASTRNNGIGIRGFSNKIKLMPLVALNDPSVRDKDFFNAVKYAVDNGAKVINYSFGKQIVERKEIYLKAIKYAKDNDVLIITAAGNEALDLDEPKNYHFPGYQVSKNLSDFDTYIKVGASSRKYQRTLLPRWANYGKNSVDVFAPGYHIWVADGIELFIKDRDGSSLSSAFVSGAAALLLSQYPNLKAKDVKDILMKSAFKTNLKVRFGDKEDTPFNTLSKSGGIINLYNAFKYIKKNKLNQ